MSNNWINNVIEDLDSKIENNGNEDINNSDYESMLNFISCDSQENGCTDYEESADFLELKEFTNSSTVDSTNSSSLIDATLLTLTPSNYSSIDYDEATVLTLKEFTNSNTDNSTESKDLTQYPSNKVAPEDKSLVDNMQSDNKTPTIKEASSEDKNGKLSYYKISNLFMKNKIIGIMDGGFFKYDTKKGYYMMLDDNNVDTYIRQTIDESLKDQICNYSIKEIVSWLRVAPDLQLDRSLVEKNSPRYIVFENVTLKLADFSIVPHDPSHCAISYVHARYNGKNNEAYYFPKFISDLTANDRTGKMHNLLQEVMGLAISNIRNLKKIFILNGEKDTGKSLYLDIIMNIVGLDSCSSTSLSDLTNDKFGLSSLFGKKINCCGESSVLHHSGIDKLKSLSGGDLISAQYKFGRQFQFYNKALMIFANNSPLKIVGGAADEAFKDRLIIINFNTKIPPEQQDFDLKEKILNEREYVVKWAIEGLKRLRANKFHFTEMDSSIETHIEDEHSEFKNFLSANVEYDSMEKCSTADLIAKYHDYCHERNSTPISDDSIHKILQQDSRLKANRFTVNGEQKRGYKGIKLIDEF